MEDVGVGVGVGAGRRDEKALVVHMGFVQLEFYGRFIPRVITDRPNYVVSSARDNVCAQYQSQFVFVTGWEIYHVYEDGDCITIRSYANKAFNALKPIVLQFYDGQNKICCILPSLSFIKMHCAFHLK